ncbi:MAG: hypothetical protein J5685_12580 [Clostridiales bacterium]|nr:hypothetical protein [Clostridiales bacterium]
MLWNLIKAETYRATRLKSVYILPVFLLCMTFIVGMVVMRMDVLSALGYTEQDIEELGEMGNSIEGFQRSFEVGFNTGMDMGRDAAEEGESTVSMSSFWGIGICYYDDVVEIFHQNMESLDQLIYVAIFAGIFFGDIFATGLDKNLIITAKHRWTLFGARIIVFGTYVMILHILRFLFSALTLLLMGDRLWWNIDGAAVAYFFLTYFLTLAFGVLLCSFCYVCRSKAATITVGVILASGALTIALSLGNYIINRAFHTSFRIENYIPSQNLSILSPVCEGETVLRSIIVGAVYFAVSYITALAVSKKRDIG